MEIAHLSLCIHDDGSTTLPQGENLLQAIAAVHLSVSIGEHREGDVQGGGKRDCKIVCVNGQSRKMCEEAKEENPYDHSTRTDR